jgi:hypothetical protein
LIDALMLATFFFKFSAMVRRHGRKLASAREEKKKRERGESSTGLDEPGSCVPKRMREEGQRVKASRSGSSPFYF